MINLSANDTSEFSKDQLHTIDEIANAIRNKTYGKDTREAMAQSLEKMASLVGLEVDDEEFVQMINGVLETRLGKQEFQKYKSEVASQLAQKANDWEVRKKLEKIKPEDLSEDSLALVTGEGTVNLETIPQDDSVTLEKVPPYTFQPFVAEGNLFNKPLNPDEFTMAEQFHQGNWLLNHNPSIEFRRRANVKTVTHLWEDGVSRTSRIFKTKNSNTSEPIENYGIKVGERVSFGLNLKLIELENTVSFGVRVIVSFRDNNETLLGNLYDSRNIGMSLNNFEHLSGSSIVPDGTTRLRIEVISQFDFKDTNWKANLEIGNLFLIKGLNNFEIYDSKQINNFEPISNTSELYVESFSNSRIYLYIKNSNDSSNTFIRYEIEHQESEEYNYDLWRMTGVSEVEKGEGNNFFNSGNFTSSHTYGSKIIGHGEWESAWKEFKDGSVAGNFIGGQIHGNEKQTDSFLEIDGRMVDLSTSTELIKCKNIRFVTKTTLYSWFDGTTELIERIKVYDFDKDGLVLGQRNEFLETTSFTLAYHSMLPINPDYFSLFYMNNDFTRRNIEPYEVGESLVNETTFIGNQVYARVKLLDLNPLSENGRSFIASSSKFYYDLINGGINSITGNEGDLWEIKTHYIVDTRN